MFKFKFKFKLNVLLKYSVLRINKFNDYACHVQVQEMLF